MRPIGRLERPVAACARRSKPRRRNSPTVSGVHTSHLPTQSSCGSRFGRLLHGEHADLREIGGGDFLGGIRGIAHDPLHIGLPGADPHFADRDILDREGVLALDGEVAGFSGSEASQLHAPFALRVRHGFGFLVAEL